MSILQDLTPENARIGQSKAVASTKLPWILSAVLASVGLYAYFDGRYMPFTRETSNEDAAVLAYAPPATGTTRGEATNPQALPEQVETPPLAASAARLTDTPISANETEKQEEPQKPALLPIATAAAASKQVVVTSKNNKKQEKKSTPRPKKASTTPDKSNERDVKIINAIMR